MQMTGKDWLGLFAMTAEEKRLVALLLALALLGIAGRYVYLHGRTVRPYEPADVPATVSQPARAPVAE